jgi:hypothetical protein
MSNSGMVDVGKTMLIQHKHNMSDHTLMTKPTKAQFTGEMGLMYYIWKTSWCMVYCSLN